MDFKLRRAVREDLLSLVDFDLEFGLSTEESSNMFFRKVLDPQVMASNLFVAEANGEIVGFIDYNIRYSKGETFVSRLYVHPYFRGFGIGSKLLLLVKRESELKRMRRVGLVTLDDGPKDFYKKWGFRDVTDYGKGGMALEV